MMSGLEAKLERLSSSRVVIVVGIIFWATVLIIGGSWFLQYRNETVKHNEQLLAIETDCKNKGGDYGLYFDNGNGELPVCRKPVTGEEQQGLQRQRAYREGLRSGDIDPEAGDPSGLNEYPY